ncbi:MAG: PAS domain-containing sensor histidine kinase [Rhodoferax sp.]|nr:PAS domain-containing sensor histidine kinase [Rhodoferax sp.]
MQGYDTMTKRARPTLREGDGTKLVQMSRTVDKNADSLDFDLLSVVVNQPMVGLYLIQNETFCWCNAVWAKNFGYKPEEVIGQTIALTSSPEALPMARYYLRMREAGDAHTIHYLIEARHRDGSPVYVESHGTRVMYQGKPAVAGVQVNITERVLRERELKKTTERLRKLTRHTNEVREKDRANVARELHDVLGGILTSLKMDASRLARRQQHSVEKDLADSIIVLAQQGIDELHRISRSLRPAVLEHLGLRAAIEDALTRFEERFSIATSLSFTGDEPVLDHLQAASVFRIFQESLTNVARHAKATKVVVEMAAVGMTDLVLSVSDNGQGISEDRREAPNAFGIMGMRERAMQLNGRLEIDGLNNAGTTVALHIPISHSGDAE